MKTAPHWRETKTFLQQKVMAAMKPTFTKITWQHKHYSAFRMRQSPSYPSTRRHSQRTNLCQRWTILEHAVTPKRNHSCHFNFTLKWVCDSASVNGRLVQLSPSFPMFWRYTLLAGRQPNGWKHNQLGRVTQRFLMQNVNISPTWPTKLLHLDSSRSTGDQHQMQVFISVTKSRKWVRIKAPA